MACRALIFATALLSTKLACSAAQTELKGGGKSTEVTGSAEGFDVDVFTAGSGEGKNGCFRIPTILSTNGTLLVFVERRFVSCNDGSPHSIELRRSVDSGRVWLPQQSLDAVGPNPPGTKSANAINGTVSNGAAVVDEMTGTIFFLYCRNVVSPFAHWTMVVSSTDLVRPPPPWQSMKVPAATSQLSPDIAELCCTVHAGCDVEQTKKCWQKPQQDWHFARSGVGRAARLRAARHFQQRRWHDLLR
eukprot:COSAG02_NODE_2008_length_10124_cov_83.805287_8_plen_246_part_00